MPHSLRYNNCFSLACNLVLARLSEYDAGIWPALISPATWAPCAHGWRAHADLPPTGKIRSAGSQQRLSRVPSESPPSPSPREHQSPAASHQTASMSKWLLGLAVLAVVAVLHIFSNVTAQSSAQEKPVSVYSGEKDTASSGSSQATAKPTWASLGRLGHELLTQTEHAYVSLSSKPASSLCSALFACTDVASQITA